MNGGADINQAAKVHYLYIYTVPILQAFEMLKDVGMDVPKSIETRSIHAVKQGMMVCNNNNMCKIDVERGLRMLLLLLHH